MPAAWNPEISLRGNFLSQKVAPVARPVFNGIQWDAPTRFTYPKGMPVQNEYRVYRGPQSGSDRTSAYRPVGFQFQK